MNALVTGGCSGLGETFTLELLKRGYKVYAFFYKSIDEALRLSEEYDNLRVIKCDIRNEEEVASNIFNLDNIDILINNAGISMDNYFKDKTKKEFMQVLEVNLVGTFLVLKYALDKMNKKGVIINISSNNATYAYTSYSIDYDASKAGINLLTKSFKNIIDEEKRDVKILAICPGYINTESVLAMNPDFLAKELKKHGQKELIDKRALVMKVIDNIDNYEAGAIVDFKDGGII